MKKIYACLLMASMCLFANAQNKKTNNNQDLKFAREAAIGGLMEVALGRIAQTNGSAQQVKELGRMMVDDHSRANQELMELAKRKNWSVPTMLDASAQEKVERLSRMRGDEFDRAYVREMEKDHRKDIQEFEKEASSGSDADLKNWAGGKVPVLRTHLEHVLGTASSLNMGGKGNKTGDQGHKGSHPSR